MHLPWSLTGGRTQVIVVSLLAFACPGMFNALNGLGGAGSSDATTANNANTALYACFAVFGYFGGFIFDLLGSWANRILLGVGGATYVFYAVAQYVAGHVAGMGWIAILSGALLGAGAGLFWTAQGAMMLAYAPEDLKGTYIAIFWVIFNLGGFLGGLLVFGINYDDVEPDASPATYFTFAGIMAAGSLAAFFLVVDPRRVVREDGEPVAFKPSGNPFAQLKEIALLFLDRRMLLLTPLFAASNFFYSYQFNAVNGALFTVRARGLNSALYWASQMLGSWVLGQLFLDRKSMGRRKRAVWGGIILAAFFTVAWALGCYLQFGWRGGYSSPADVGQPIDITDSAAYAFPIVVFLLYGIGDAMLQVYAYYIMGALTDDLSKSAAYAGYYKGIQSAFAAVAWQLDNVASWRAQFIVNWVLFTLSVPFYMWVALKHVEDTKVETLRRTLARAQGEAVKGADAKVVAQAESVEA
ncbi:major facilitator superfamily domain-containing protein [Hyaloraphidium curvatum]|nr:major facilitator superfamily domain-containing protein [Hyaloraphidium curvatum]